MFIPFDEFPGIHVATPVVLPASKVGSFRKQQDEFVCMINDDIKSWLNGNTYWTYEFIRAKFIFEASVRRVIPAMIQFYILNSDTAVMFKLIHGGE